MMPMAALLLASLLLRAAAAAEHAGCPACGRDLPGHKISTVHPGEPAVSLAGVATPGACRAQCLQSSADVLFFQHSTSASGHSSCLCLATCYSVAAKTEAGGDEETVSGSLCRDGPRDCPNASTCSTHPTPNRIYLGTPARVISRPFLWMTLGANGTASNATHWIPLNGTLLLSNSSSLAPSNYSNSTGGNSTLAGAYGMSFEECRALAASNTFPLTPFFSHLEAMSTCLLFDKCVGVAPAGTSTAKSGSFCVPTVLEEPTRAVTTRKHLS